VALAATVIVPETAAPSAGELTDTVGGVVSALVPFETVTVTVADVATLPAASKARAAIVCVPLLTAVVSKGTE
jgi:hypothetical protein